MIATCAPTFIVKIGGQELPEDISAHIETFSYKEDEKQMAQLSITITKGDLSAISLKSGHAPRLITLSVKTG